MPVAERPSQLAPATRVRIARIPALPWLAVAALCVVGAALRAASIHQSLFGDELFLYSRVHGQSFTHMLALVHDNENTPPLFFVFTWLVARGSHAMLLVRVPSLLANVAAIALTFVLGRRTFGVRAGLLGAAWFALSPFQIFYGTDDRAYAAVGMLVVIATLALLAALQAPQQRRWWAIYAVAALAAIYTHYVATLVLVPQALWGLWRHRETVRRQLAWHGLVIAAFLPWIPFFILQAKHSGRESVRLSSLVPLTPSNAIKTEVQSLLGHPFIPPGKLPGVVPVVVLCVLLIGVALAFGRHWAGVRRFLATERGLVALLATSPIALIVIYSLRPHTSLLLPRNLEVGVPYACVVIGWLLARWPLPWAAGLSVIAFAALGVGTVKIMSTAYQRPDGRAAAQFIDANAASAAAVIDFPGPQGTQFYFRRPHRLYPLTFSWSAAARVRQQVFLTYLTGAPCSSLAPGYMLVTQRRWPSVPLPLAVCEYVPATANLRTSAR